MTSTVWTISTVASDSEGVAIPTSQPPCHVTDQLYISNMLTASLFIKGIATAYYSNAPRITHVLSIISGKPWQMEVVKKSMNSSIAQKKIILQDRPDANLIEHFPDICKFIHNALAEPNAQVLVHCFAGISRSASAIAAYLIYAKHMTYKEALTVLRASRPEVNPNPGFQFQLTLWRDLDCELLDGDDDLKEEYAQAARRWRLGRKVESEKPDLFALRSLQRPEPPSRKRDYVLSTTEHLLRYTDTIGAIMAKFPTMPPKEKEE